MHSLETYLPYSFIIMWLQKSDYIAVSLSVCLGKGDKSSFLLYRSTLSSDTHWCPVNAAWEQWQCLKQMGEEPDVNFTHWGCMEYVTLPFPSSASAVVSSDTPGSYRASSSCKSVSRGLFPIPVSCSEGQAPYSYGVSVCTIWPIKVAIVALQSNIIIKYNYIYQSSCLGPWKLLGVQIKTTKKSSKTVIWLP